MNIYDLISRAQKLRKETQLDSVSPDRVGGLHEDTLKYINEFQLLASSPSLHKIYASVSAMQSDKSPKSDLTGKPLKPGQLVVIVPANQTDATAGDVYRYDGPSGNTSAWTFVAKIGAVPADAELSATSTNPPQNKVVTEKLTELESETILSTRAIGFGEESLIIDGIYINNTGAEVSNINAKSTDFIHLPLGWKKLRFRSELSSITSLILCGESKNFIASVPYEGSGFTEVEYRENVKYVRFSSFNTWKQPILFVDVEQSYEQREKELTRGVRGISEIIVPISVCKNAKTRILNNGTFTTNDYSYSSNILKLPKLWEYIKINLWQGSLNSICLYDKDYNVVEYHNNEGEITIYNTSNAEYYAIMVVDRTDSVDNAIVIGYKESAKSLVIKKEYQNITCEDGLINKSYIVQPTNGFKTSDFIPLGDWESINAVVISSGITGICFFDHNKYPLKCVRNTSPYSGVIHIDRQDAFKAAYVRLSWPDGSEDSMEILLRNTQDTFYEKTESARVYNRYKKIIEDSQVLFSTENTNSKVCRVPQILTCDNGNIIAVCQAQQGAEDHAQMGIALRLFKNGAWNDVKMVLPYSNTYGRTMNPSLVKGENGRIYLFVGTCKVDGVFAINLGREENDMLYIYSDNHGESWSGVHSLKEYFSYSFDFAFPSPSNGLFYNGVIYIPCMYGLQGVWYSGLCHNAKGNWEFSPITLTSQDNESTIYEYGGEIYLNCRNDRGAMFPYYRSSYRYILEKNEFEEVYDYFKPYARCQGYIKNVDGNLLRSFPNSVNNKEKDGGLSARINNTIWVSNDNEKWSALAQVSAIGGYTSFDVFQDTIHCIYEDSEQSHSCLLAVVNDASQLISDAISEVNISLEDKF